jgi:hypothetical protein
MPNMSYCRFQNTYRDLDDCYEAIINYEEGKEELSEEEQAYKNKLIELCKEIVDYCY